MYSLSRMYFVGSEHPLRTQAREFFIASLERNALLVTSSEVLQELLHRYVRRDRQPLLDAAFDLVAATVHQVWPVENADVVMARNLSCRASGA